MAPGDYIAISPPEQLPVFTLADPDQSFSITIVDDTFAELEEQFTAVLENLADQTNFPRVTVAPDVATITIEDDDGK